MSIFDFSDYRSFLRTTLAAFPHKGRGKQNELANRLRIHPSVISQVFTGHREFSEEQAIEIAEWLGLAPEESRYLRMLVRLENAGSSKLKAALKSEVAAAARDAKSLATRVGAERELSDSERAVFYSSWLYSACRLYCSTGARGRTIDEIIAHFEIPRPQALEVMNFLVRSGLVTGSHDRYKLGTQSTFVDRGSPFMGKHLANWHIKALQAADHLDDDELMFSGPFSVSRADFAAFKDRLGQLLKEFSKMVKDSPAEEIACLNIDYFRIRG